VTAHRCEASPRRMQRPASAVSRVASFSRVATVVLAALLGGCGQLGPLYLPPPASEVIKRPAADASSPPTATTPTATPAETRTP
jgi:predicted small lipoprotein YifL